MKQVGKPFTIDGVTFRCVKLSPEESKKRDAIRTRAYQIRTIQNVLTCLKDLRQSVLADGVYSPGVDLAIAAVESMPKEN